MTEVPTAGARDDVRAGIVDAAARLLRDHGARAMTTRGVAQVAGVQAPTIYRLFGDKDGLVDAVAEHVVATYVATKTDLEVEADPVADLRAGWDLHVEFGLAHPSCTRSSTTPSAADTRRPRPRGSRCCGPRCGGSRPPASCASTRSGRS